MRRNRKTRPPARLVADESLLARRRGAGEEESGGICPRAGRRDEDPAFVLLGLNRVLDEGEAERSREPGDRLVIVADDEGNVGEGLGHPSLVHHCRGSGDRAEAIGTRQVGQGASSLARRTGLWRVVSD